MADEVMTCPFCGWEAVEGEYAMLLHMETLHAEGQSPFVPDKEPDASSSTAVSNNEENSQYVACPVEGCGEEILHKEMDFHIEMHAEEAEGDDHPDSEIDDSTSQIAREPSEKSRSEFVEDPSTSRRERRGRTHEHRKSREPGRDHVKPSRSPVEEVESRQAKAIKAWKNLLHMPTTARRHPEGSGRVESEKSKRLGKAALGKYAHEDRMPEWLVTHLQKGVMTSTEGVVPVLARLMKLDSSTKYAYLCHPRVQHVSKLRKEGGFCGYRNIQSLVSYMIGANVPGSEAFGGEIPTIFQIQDLIEAAWDQGINSEGRVETGGIKGTRKYIGTPEALAMFRLLNIPCDCQGYKHQAPGKSEALLMEDIEKYFQQGVVDPQKRVRQTNMPPIYFQHAGHSMTIIGFERLRNGDKNLIVFDPMFHDTRTIAKLIGDKNFDHRFPDLPLKSYRRGSKYLKKYKEFELLKLRLPSDHLLFAN